MSFNASTLSKINTAVTKKRMGNGNATLNKESEMLAMMKREAQQLQDMIQLRIDMYYQIYKPKFYERTYKFKNSLAVTPVTYEGGRFKVKVYFKPESYYRSWRPEGLEDSEKGFVPSLMMTGWHVKSGWHKNIENFGQSNFLDKVDIIDYAIREFEMTNKYNLKIDKNISYK